MSGGLWQYDNDTLAQSIYGWDMLPDYGEDGFSQSTEAWERNPLEDKLMSELVWDVFCVLHSYDWYKSGDTCEDSYREDVETFKSKWLRGIGGDKIKEMIDRELESARESLKKSLGGIRDE